ncbi:hypothetical protein ACIRSS_33145 [Amycolatopsis sp. NPDC101161]|uniref:hypothetical protein n=1 Tax=Amycolatopsis sp. NPDC101161 TaxID=3363940 RepID=UPI0038295ED8
MSWQEDLRRLDADLAAGRIEPATHRKQRDELLAAASGSTVPSPVPSPLRRPGGQRSWQSTNPASAPPAEPVPAPRPVSKPVTPQERPWMRTPQAAKTPAPSGIPALPDHMTTAPSPADIVPTRYLRVDGHVPVPPPLSRFPPVAGDAGAPTGPEAEPGRHRFPGREDGQGRPVWLFLTLGVVVVLVLVVGGTYWLGTRTDNHSDAALPLVPTTAAPTNGAIDPQIPLDQRLPALPGKPNDADSTMSIDKALEAKVITEADAKQLQSHNAKEIIFRASSDLAKPRNGNLLMAIPTLSVFDAKHLAAGLRNNLSGAHLAATQIGPTDNDLMYTQRGTDGWVAILWYSSGAVVVGVGVSQRETGDSAELQARLKAIRDTVATVLPPG